MSWKEYDLENRSIADWLPWGGIVDPCIVRNKDDSFFGILEYQPYPDAEKDVKLPEFRNGWSLWNEHQHIPQELGFADRYFLVLCWNPFLDAQKRIINPLGPKKIPENEDKSAFSSALKSVQKSMREVTNCHLLEYQEIMDFLSFALSLGEEHVTMPDVPLYLDAVLSEDLDLDLTGNNIIVNGKNVFVFSLPTGTDWLQEHTIDDSFVQIPYRHVQRLLLMSEKSADKTLRKFMSKWCGGRKSVRQLLMRDLSGKLNGYYSDSYFLLVPQEREDTIGAYAQNILNLLHIPYTLEDFNRKDIWWGSLPAIFRANITPPQVGFSGLSEILYHPQTATAKEGASRFV